MKHAVSRSMWGEFRSGCAAFLVRFHAGALNATLHVPKARVQATDSDMSPSCHTLKMTVDESVTHSSSASSVVEVAGEGAAASSLARWQSGAFR